MKGLYFGFTLLCLLLACGFFEGGGYFWGSVFGLWGAALAIIWRLRVKED